MSIDLNSSLGKRLLQNRLIAVLMVDREEDAVPLAQALLDGGIDIIELTLRTPAAIGAMRRIKDEVPGMTVGIGTVLTPGQVDEIVEAGAAFGVSPGLNPRVVAHAREAGLPFGPGVCTPSDIESAVELGCHVLKFFPAESIGGLAYLNVIAAPYVHLDISFIPLGGIRTANLEEYLANPLVAAVGGSWIAPRNVIKEQAWDRIRETAREAAECVARMTA